MRFVYYFSACITQLIGICLIVFPVTITVFGKNHYFNVRMAIAIAIGLIFCLLSIKLWKRLER